MPREHSSSGARRLCILFASAVLATRVSGCGATVEPVAPRFTIAVVNMENRDIPVADDVRRYREFTRRFKDRVPFWSLIGLQELRYDKRGSFFDYQYLDDEEIAECADGAEPDHPAMVDCFGRGLLTSISRSHRGIGIVAQEYEWELVDDRVYKDYIGEPKIGGVIYRTVFGARFRHKRIPDFIVPFYTVHLSNTDDDARQFKEVVDLVVKIKQWQVPGDMPPIIAGDFNCHHFSRGIKNTLYADFEEVSHTNAVLLVFVGRPQSFPNARASWKRPTQSGPVTAPLDIGSANDELTDHPTTIAQIEADLDIAPADVSWPYVNTSGGGGCHP